MINQIKTLYELTRAYALPMSIFSWLVAFCYAATLGGNTKYGMLALLGICFAHLGTNVLDDYIDYFRIKNSNFDDEEDNIEKGKCRLLLTGAVTERTALNIALVLFVIALMFGVFFTIKIGYGVLLFMGLAGLLAVLYPVLVRYRLCEIALCLIYGPILFGGICYVMTGQYDWKTIIVCLPTMFMTLNMLYTDTLMDYDFDKKIGKKTIANMFETKWKSLDFHKILLAIAYLSVSLTYVLDIADWEVFVSFGTIPMASNLLDAMKIYIVDSQKYDFDDISFESNTFMVRMSQAKNLMICFSLMFAIALLFKIST